MAEWVPVSRRNRLLLLIGALPLGVLLFVVAAWGIDTAVTGDRVVRNVTVGGTSIGGLSAADLDGIAVDLTTELSSEPATLVVGDAVIATDPVALGVRVDADVLTEQALDARRGGFFLTRPFRWVGTFFSEHDIDVPYTVDADAADGAVAQLVETELDDPIEPVIDLVDGELMVTAGADGATLDPALLTEALPGMMAAGAPYELSLEPDPLHPDLDDTTLEAIADEANAATADPITVRVITSDAVVESAQLRTWVTLDLEADEPSWSIDNATAIAELRPMFPRLGTDEQQAHFEIVDNRPVIVPASESVVCCAADTGERLFDALVSGDTDAPIELETETTDADAGVEALEALGIIEEVGTFTTKHDCCQNRVTNIHLIADIVRGAIIEPGESFSLNGFVGRRTTERGFVPAGAIASGVVEDQVGGGVSQFATTTFNAAFFAGLEIPEYQSHSLYFSRYPRGREATVSWPAPDLVIQNDTPYGVLIWTSYTDTTITVTMYSTKHMTVEDVGRTEAAQNLCTRVTTTRKRTYADGTSELDSFFAVYRPGEGLNCAGESTTPTTEPPPTTVPEGGTPPETTVPDGGTPPETTVPDTTTTTTG